MDENLIRIEESFIQEVIEKGGAIDLDLSNDLHYNYYCKQLEKLGANPETTPNLMKLLDSERNVEKKSLSNIANGEEVLIGPTDIVFIDIPEFKRSKQLRNSEVGNGESAISVNSVARYCNKKSSVIIQSTIKDNIKNRSITETSAFTDCEQVEGTVKMNENNLFDGKPRNYTFVSDFTSVGQNADGKPKLKVSSTARNNVVIDADIIESFTLTHPKPIKNPGAKQVKVSYMRDSQMPDFDYSIDNAPQVDPKDSKKYIRIKLDVSLTLIVKSGYVINGLKSKTYPIITVDHPYQGKGVIKCYQYAQTKPPLVNIKDKTKAEVSLQKESGEHNAADWVTIIPFDDLEDKISVGLNIYGQFIFSITKVVDESNPKNNITFDLPVSFRSEKGDLEFTKQNIETESIFMRWGCIGKDTLITLADKERTVIKISEIKIGDFIITDDGDKREVIDIITGKDDTIISITTDSKRNILLTKGHSIKVNGKWITVGELKEGMKVQCENGVETVTELKEQPYGDMVYNLKFKEETAIIGNGFIIGDYDMQQRIKPYKEEKEIVWSEETKMIADEIKSLNLDFTKGV